MRIAWSRPIRCGIAEIRMLATLGADMALYKLVLVTLRERMRESVAPFLGPGETVQVVFGAMARSPVTAAFAAEFGGGRDHYKWRIVVVTPQRILVLDAGPSGRRATGVLAELPRSKRLGPPFGVLMHVIPLEGERLRVPRRFFKDIKAADSLMSASG